MFCSYCTLCLFLGAISNLTRPKCSAKPSETLGNNFYSLLTGVYPFFNVEEDKDIRKKITGHKIAQIDPRYYDLCSEGKLAKTILKMWEFWPEERPEITEVRQLLLDGIEVCEKEEEQRKKVEARQRAEYEELAKMEAQDRAQAEKAEAVAHELAEKVQHAQEEAFKELQKEQPLTADLAHHALMKERAGHHNIVAGDHAPGAVVPDPVA